jgi:hypothetical protein
LADGKRSLKKDLIVFSTSFLSGIMKSDILRNYYLVMFCYTNVQHLISKSVVHLFDG